MKQVTNVALDAELHKRAKVFAADRGISLARLVEMALQEYLKGNTKR